MLNDLLIFVLVVLLSVAVPLSIVAAYGFRGSPFGKVTGPIPIVLICYIIADGSQLYLEQVSSIFYAVVTSIAVVAAVYAAINGALLLTERRKV